MIDIFECDNEQYTVERRAPKQGELYTTNTHDNMVFEAHQDFKTIQKVLTPVRYFDAYWYNVKIRLFQDGTVQMYHADTGSRLQMTSFEPGLLRAILKLQKERPQCKPKPPTIQEMALAIRELLSVLHVNVTRRSGLETHKRKYKSALDTLKELISRAEEAVV